MLRRVGYVMPGMLHAAPCAHVARCKSLAARCTPRRRGGQIVGVGDTGIDADSCFFADGSAIAVPYRAVNYLHRKIVACEIRRGRLCLPGSAGEL